MDKAALLRSMFDAAVAAADPMVCVPSHLPAPPSGRLIVVGAGKASARMARAVEAHWEGPLEGLVVTRYGHGTPCERIEIREAAHPVPDAAGEAATRAILDLANGAGEDDLVLALISGGGSALLTAPAGDVTLEQKRALNDALLRSGAPIGAMNTVRKHLSLVKGGRLAAAAHPARLLALMISDVPGDDPGTIASGPTVGTESTGEDAAAILRAWNIAIPPSVEAALAGSAPPAPDDPRLSRIENRIVAAPQLSLEAAAETARVAGYTPIILGDAIEGESREVARVLAAIALQVRRHDQPAPAPCALLSGGETTVTIRGEGRGGRNVEFLLALALALDGTEGIAALAADTDGVDGAEEIAGAIVDPTTLARARQAGLDPAAMLASNDAHSFFEALGDGVVTGPTLTNVNDFRAILID